ncbi:DUF4430 domain-containing protein [Desulfosporosinus meridiei]|uniref:DUF4430 domain-containing protein n=1 Tax=Desulfosporosinus meridiei (strain ATCC BAA-275 / DSM 13257 / KCTC 12902 / NCIMB 13706 / S10) TaxID=768704 RepID=J7IR13_DESMD|nr:DUF4430 domain-containing protein [Desulfosporosinus meridiei]AFQ42624.1 hypothetical protein Desmer_0590 [Desulfosporosinus meridiei DSM 13257]
MLKIKQKFLGLAMTLTLGLTFFVAPAPAEAAMDTLTFADSEHFNILGEIDDEVTNIQVVGLDGTTGMTEEIADPENIQWTTSDSSVVKFLDGTTEVATIDDTDTVKIKLLDEGRAYITVHYDAMEISAYVVVESDSAATPSISGISVQVDAPGTANDLSVTNQTVYLTDLAWLADQYNTLQKNCSALHALAMAGNTHYSDPDWAENNLTLFNGGGYVYGIGSDFDSGVEGWQYYVVHSNSSMDVPDYPASRYELQSGDTVVWEYKWLH